MIDCVVRTTIASHDLKHYHGIQLSLTLGGAIVLSGDINAEDRMNL